MRKIIFSFMLLVGTVLPISQPTLAFASTGCPSNTTSRGQVLEGVGQSGSTGCNDSGVSKTLSVVVGVLSVVVGAVAIIMIIVGGFKYITSSGDANKIKNAKDTLLYALIGVAIAALAQLLVHFVLNQANGLGT